MWTLEVDRKGAELSAIKTKLTNIIFTHKYTNCIRYINTVGYNATTGTCITSADN